MIPIVSTFKELYNKKFHIKRALFHLKGICFLSQNRIDID